MKRLICALLVCSQLAACSSLSTVPYGEGAAGAGSVSPIARGDTLRILFREGGEKVIKVTSASDDEICAADGCIRAAEIAMVQRSELKLESVALTILGFALLAAVLVGLAGGLGGLGGGGLGSGGLGSGITF